MCSLSNASKTMHDSTMQDLIDKIGSSGTHMTGAYWQDSSEDSERFVTRPPTHFRCDESVDTTEHYPMPFPLEEEPRYIPKTPDYLPIHSWSLGMSHFSEPHRLLWDRAGTFSIESSDGSFKTGDHDESLHLPANVDFVRVRLTSKPAITLAD